MPRPIERGRVSAVVRVFQTGRGPAPQQTAEGGLTSAAPLRTNQGYRILWSFRRGKWGARGETAPGVSG